MLFGSKNCRLFFLFLLLQHCVFPHSTGMVVSLTGALAFLLLLLLRHCFSCCRTFLFLLCWFGLVWLLLFLLLCQCCFVLVAVALLLLMSWHWHSPGLAFFAMSLSFWLLVFISCHFCFCHYHGVVFVLPGHCCCCSIGIFVVDAALFVFLVATVSTFLLFLLLWHCHHDNNIFKYNVTFYNIVT